MPIDLNHAVSVAETLARRSGTFLREALLRPRQITFKGPINLVTESDKHSEEILVAGLTEAFPDHHIVGEEGGGMGASMEAAQYRWYIDPLDGTTNYAHTIPHFSVSMALSGTDDLPLLGVVYDPMRDELFRTVRGQGATLNGRPIHVSAVDDLARAVVCTGFPYDRWTDPDNNGKEFVSLITRSQGTARMGSVALELSWTAAGRFDGFWEMKINPWDVMAGLLLVTEAGGKISNYQGHMDAGVYMGRRFCASNGLIHDQLVTVLSLGEAAPRPNVPKQKS